MQKNTLAISSVKITAALAMLVAISIVCGKYLAFGVGNVLRFSFENLPIIIAGAAFGPIAGLLVGTVADLVGCLLVGYAINPLVTLGAAVIGLLSGSLWYLCRKVPLWTKTTVSVFFSHLVGSVLIKTLGLAIYYDMPIIILMLWRLLNYVIVGAIEGTMIYFLMKNKMVTSQISSIKNSIKRDVRKAERK